ncbi:endonuclease/exonuclease/phosphatase family protein [Paeniglutamicibacter kerguelensis]|uniref:Vancomycin resistance protein VanJ n=1 Tax=Paeniglutamicibacter kerguelensis TaxID=254788 RepID=A0ABS4XGV8_9MICC|nr:endonuclease/exonuclease/phosphatase family protein [Paeniglutamicibacter kerguelensis]MBP2387488.1 vancomycin resistance protein VanJ [Paeniglutamicibacter kerguelensis]
MSVQTASAPPRQRKPRRLLRWQRQLRALVLLGALLSTLLMVFHSRVPDFMGLALLVDNAAPWLGLAAPVLLLAALISKSRGAVAFALVPALVWLAGFGAAIVPLSWTAPAASAHTLTVSSQNIKAGTGAAAESARELARGGSDVIALQELDAGSGQDVTAALNADYPHHFVVGTVGVWSKYPLSQSQPLDLGLGWKRALTTQIDTEAGSIRLYAVHAASARPNDHGNRDEMLAQLAATLRADTSHSVIAVGDFNATSADRSFSSLTETLDEPNQDAGLFGFTWPREPFGFMRLDHVLQRGLDVTSNTVVPAGESDHLAVRATVNLPDS